MQKSLISFLILIAILIQPGYAQESNRSLGWDLTYTSVLERNNVARSEWIWKWLNSGYQGSNTRSETPSKKWIAEWQGEPIVSSILFEYPAFHAGEHITQWFVRTKNDAFYWRIVEDANPEVEKQSLNLQAYDDLFREVSSWQQAKPKSVEDTVRGGLPGYIGFLNLYEKGESRQMLLTMEDFIICDTKECKTKETGRVFRVLLDLPEDRPCLEKKYKTKSEAALAAMTPRQLVDELVKINHNSFNTYKEWADYEDSIEIKIRKAGVEVLPVLTEYMNAYEPQGASLCDRTRFAAVRHLAHDIDRFELRLRGTKEGQQTIDAFEHAIERMEKIEVTKNTNDERNLFLNPIKGINDVDEAIQDTFWVKRKIKLSDSELLKFSNFLTERDPTYPTWSNTDYIKDYSRTNEYGYGPLQVYIFKKPQRFYEAYSEFKKKRLKNAR